MLRSAYVASPPDTASGWRLARFSALAVPVAAAQLPLAVTLPTIFSRDFGIPLTTLGLILLFGRLWDAVTDPVIGALSDRTISRFGRRKPWIVGGTALFLAAAVALFFPPDHISVTYLAVVLGFFYLGWTAMQIPFMAWSGEVSGRYHERTRIATYQGIVTAVALLITLVLPTIADQMRPGDGRLQLTLMGLLVVVTTVPCVLLTLTAFPERETYVEHERFSFRDSLSAVFANPLLLRVLASDFAVTLGQSTRAGLIVFFVTFYMGRPEWAAGLYLFQFLFGILAGPIWLRVGKALGKHRAAILGETVQVVINLGLLLVTPDTVGLLLALTVAQGLAQGSGNLMLRAIVSDVADLNRLETGRERTGLYFSVFSLSAKAASAVAIGVTLPLIALYGFDPKAVVNTPEALRGLLLVFALGPAIAHTLSALLLAGFPLDEKRHAVIRRQLDASDAMAAARLAPAE